VIKIVNNYEDKILRLYHYKQIVEVLRTIKQIQSAGLYADCQEAVEVLTTFVSDIDANCKKTVELLEMYYETLNKVSIGEADYSCLAEQINRISKSIEIESQPHKIEAVFITHRASMSDSIESIYLAAKADPDCDAFWIPVPHIMHNLEGKPDIVHFEGAEHYGKGIDVTQWQEYDIKARHPDIIFTFNAYDSFNGVSSIHPDYYSEILCDQTDLLIYIPYYVDIDDGSADGYSQLPGCVYSHKTILSTNKMRDIYSQRFNQRYEKILGKINDKFIALGSPKYDKAINAKREDYELPSRWKELVDKKKIISYISSIGPSLETRNTYLGKLRSILKTFQKRDDVIVWWRPHPLLESSFRALVPDLLPEYQKIVADFISEDRGIYDDTSELHRAIVWGDGFYGDWSSLVLLYQITGKPVMLADTTTLLERLKPGLSDCRYESETDTLSNYIDGIVNGKLQRRILKNEEKGIINADGTAGKVIYEYAKEIILNID